MICLIDIMSRNRNKLTQIVQGKKTSYYLNIYYKCSVWKPLLAYRTGIWTAGRSSHPASAAGDLHRLFSNFLNCWRRRRRLFSHYKRHPTDLAPVQKNNIYASREFKIRRYHCWWSRIFWKLYLQKNNLPDTFDHRLYTMSCSDDHTYVHMHTYIYV